MVSGGAPPEWYLEAKFETLGIPSPSSRNTVMLTPRASETCCKRVTEILVEPFSYF